ncbi:hypothetical protein RIF29_21827 [Crotalaria pallida]|uniref:Uncharacterized protein n=1 Tax=Crotalaria pallida TaxID=3830 RepID=A0AAN9IDT6_CROPI
MASKKQKRQSKGKKDDPDSNKMEKVDTDRLVTVPIGDKAVDKISPSGAKLLLFGFIGCYRTEYKQCD